MKRTFLALTLGSLVISASAALALTTEQVVADYQAAGYSRVEVRVGPTQMKVEAIRGTEKREVVYDRASGAILKAETETVGALENTRPGVSVRERGRDFVRGGDDDGDRRGDDDGDRRDDRDDDNDDDSSDDNGGDRDRDDSRSDDDGDDNDDNDDNDDSDDSDSDDSDDSDDSSDRDGSDD